MSKITKEQQEMEDAVKMVMTVATSRISNGEVPSKVIQGIKNQIANLVISAEDRTGPDTVAIGILISEYREHLEAADIISDLLERNGIERPWVRRRIRKDPEIYTDGYDGSRLRLERR